MADQQLMTLAKGDIVAVKCPQSKRYTADEDGVPNGVALCFDEYANGGDHGISIFYNGAAVWEELAACGNREGCEPVSLFEDAAWHTIDMVCRT